MFAPVPGVAFPYLSLIVVDVQAFPEPAQGISPQLALRTLRFKVRSEAYPWLNAASVEVNQIWNYCNATRHKAAKPLAGKGRWLSGFDLRHLTSGATEYFAHIRADSIQRICVEYAQKRSQAK